MHGTTERIASSFLDFFAWGIAVRFVTLAQMLVFGIVIAGPCVAVEVELMAGTGANEHLNRLHNDSEFMLFMRPRSVAGTPASQFQVRFELPEGTGFDKVLGLYSSTWWDCTGTPIGADTVVCNGPPGSLPLGAHLMLQLSTVNTPPGAQTEFRVYLEDLTSPFPSPPTCVPDTSTTGCTSLTTPVIQSAVRIGHWNNPDNGPARIDEISVPTSFAVRSYFQVEGYRRVHVLSDPWLGDRYEFRGAPTEVELVLPPELETNPNASSWYMYNPWSSWTCTQTVDGDHEVIFCQDPMPYSHELGTNSVAGNVRLKNGVAVTGAVPIHVAVGNDYMPMPTDCADASELQANEQCGRLMVTVLTPADLRFTSITHTPDVFVPGQEGQIQLNYKNLGTNHYSAQLGVQIQLPPGLEYLSSEHSAEIIACSVFGTPAEGQAIKCSAASPPGYYFEGLAQGWVDITVRPDPQVVAIPGPVEVVSSLGSAGSNIVLPGCVSEPTQSHCALHSITTWLCAAARYGADGIFCDGSEELIPGVQDTMGDPWVWP